jgi:hypothetical protein
MGVLNLKQSHAGLLCVVAQLQEVQRIQLNGARSQAFFNAHMRQIALHQGLIFG